MLVLGEAAKDLSANKESLFQAEEQSAKEKQAGEQSGESDTAVQAKEQSAKE